MVRVKRFGIVQTAKVVAALYFAVTVVIGVPLGLVLLLTGLFLGQGESILSGLAAMFIMPVLYGVFAFIGGIIICFAYNFVARYTGGIEIELEHER